MINFQLIQKIKLSKLSQVDIRVVRDDLYPFPGGGNKARKIHEIEKEIKKDNADAVVTTGGIQSNHCRAAAVIAAENGWPCHLVLHGEKERFYREKGNALLMRKAGATPTFVEPEGISDAMDEAMLSFRNNNYNPFYIQGGGHSVAGARAYVLAIQRMEEYFQDEKWYPDAIFLASGTGSTQAGILAGLEICNLGGIPVFGISVARKKDRGKEKIESLLHKMAKKLDCKKAIGKVNFYDNWISGGYESNTPKLAKVSDEVFEQTGMPLDQTYSAKAWLGMSEMIKNNSVSGNILFWHTGGILNLMA